MTKKNQSFQITAEQRNQVLQELSHLLKGRVQLQQKLYQQQEQVRTTNESLFLELLEVFDALEFLIDYITTHPEPDSKAWLQLRKSLESVEQKFSKLLSKQQVNPIEVKQSEPDFAVCQVVDQVVCHDVEPGTLVEVTRKGFSFGDKVLRPVEVIVSKRDR
jgi:molecular chaperone GrpE